MATTKNQTAMCDIPQVSAARAFELVMQCVQINQPVILWGPPGCAKSSIMRQVAAALNRKFLIFNTAIHTSVDLTGIPVPDIANKRAIWLTPEELPVESRDGPDPVFCIDDLTLGTMSMMASLFSAVLEKRVGTHHFPAGTAVVATANRVSDKSGANKTPLALDNRFMHFEIVPDVKSFELWGSANGCSPFITEFLKFRPELLFAMPGTKIESLGIEITSTARAWPSMRAWEACSAFVPLPADIRQQMIGGRVGVGPASEFEAFMRVVSTLPSLSEVIADPQTAKCPTTDPAAKYAIAAFLVRNATRANFDAILEYAERLGREFQTMVAINAKKQNADLAETGGFTTWAVDNQDVTL
jgi:hypothetical protein